MASASVPSAALVLMIIVLSAIIALALAKICPRKKLLLTSSAGISLSLICLGTYYYFLAFLGVSE